MIKALVGTVTFALVHCAIAQTPLEQHTECKAVMRAELSFDKPGSGEKRDAARGFLWKHWFEKGCGDLYLTSWSREGQRSDSHFKIEPTEDAAMRLDVVIVGSDAPPQHVVGMAVTPAGIVRSPQPETTSYTVTSVERIEIKIPFIVGTAKAIQGVGYLPSGKYLLRFKDKDGKAITSF